MSGLVYNAYLHPATVDLANIAFVAAPGAFLGHVIDVFRSCHSIFKKLITPLLTNQGIKTRGSII